ncbi:TfoX/Sxy family protein [Candidatus Wolfebacteria bacterium]|nr:TfoX/Sxy family protein [Candidatus Wolfebacteria bacterium]
MSTKNEYVEYILDLLAPLGQVETARMFGGTLLKKDGKQLGVVFRDTLYFKVINSDVQKRYKSEGSEQFTYTRKDKKDPVVIKNWWTVPEDSLDNSEKLVLLAEEVLRSQDS